MNKNIVLIPFTEIISFPCVSSNLADSDWVVTASLYRGPRNYYRVALLSHDSNAPVNSLIYVDGHCSISSKIEQNAVIIALYPKTGAMPTFEDEFISEWIKTRPDNISVEYIEEFGMDYHKSKLNTLSGVVHCKLSEPLFTDEELKTIKDKRSKANNLTPDVLDGLSVQLDNALEKETKESLINFLTEERKEYNLDEIYLFAEWCGEGYIKCGGGWMAKYSSQIKAIIFTTAQLYDIYNNLKNVNIWKTKKLNA